MDFLVALLTCTSLYITCPYSLSLLALELRSLIFLFLEEVLLSFLINFHTVTTSSSGVKYKKQIKTVLQISLNVLFPSLQYFPPSSLLTMERSGLLTLQNKSHPFPECFSFTSGKSKCTATSPLPR